MTKRAAAPKQAPATQAEIQKALFDELTKGLSCAARSHTALDKQEHLTLLAEAEIAYQNALCLVMQAGILTGSPIEKKLRQLCNFLKKNDTLQEG
jgi:hypothetical protein